MKQGGNFFAPDIVFVKKGAPASLCNPDGYDLMDIKPDMTLRFTCPEAERRYMADIWDVTSNREFASFESYMQFMALKSSVTYAIFKALPPAGFSVCRESRSCLMPLLTKVPSSCSELSGEGVDLSIPTWVNFAIDTVQCKQYDLPHISRTPWVSHIGSIVLDVDDTDSMHSSMDSIDEPYLFYLTHDMTGLRHLTIKFMEPRGDKWYYEWFDLLAEYYNRCDPWVDFYLRIINPNFPNMEELNPKNFMRLWRKTRRQRQKLTNYPDYPLPESDSEEDFDVLNHPYEWVHNGKDCLTKCGKGRKW
jgi:hypothetical protein